MKIFLTTFFFLSLVLSACQDIMPSGIEICKENYMPTNHKGWKYDKSIISIQDTANRDGDNYYGVKTIDSANNFIADNHILVKQNGDVFVNPFFLNNVFGINDTSTLYDKILCILPCHTRSVEEYNFTIIPSYFRQNYTPLTDSAGDTLIRISPKIADVLSYDTYRYSEEEEIFNGVATKVVTVFLTIDYHLKLLEPVGARFASSGDSRLPIVSGSYVIKFAHNYGIISIRRGDGATTKLLNLL